MFYMLKKKKYILAIFQNIVQTKEKQVIPLMIPNGEECENKDFCNIVMPSKDNRILEFNQYQKSDKAPFIIYADLECLIEKIGGCLNNPENSSIIKVTEYIPSGFSMFTLSSFKSIENKHNVYRGNDCIKTF